MGSGYFPLREDEPNGKKLLQAADLIREVVMDPEHREQDQYDNAMSDGGSHALLALAEKLVRDEVRKT